MSGQTLGISCDNTNWNFFFPFIVFSMSLKLLRPLNLLAIFLTIRLIWKIIVILDKKIATKLLICVNVLFNYLVDIRKKPNNIFHSNIIEKFLAIKSFFETFWLHEIFVNLRFFLWINTFPFLFLIMMIEK
jgi:hypothetical protein